MTETNAYDVVIVGGGHNGLVTAAYLAAAGLSCVVLERRSVVGGACVTEEFHPGFRNSVASYTVSLLHPKIIKDLDLMGAGLRLTLRRMAYFMPLDDGTVLDTNDKADLAHRWPDDARRMADYEARIQRVADVIQELVLETPPNVVDGGVLAALGELIRTARVAGRLRKLDQTAQRDLLELFARSAGEILDNWFDSPAIKGMYGFDAIVGSFQSPYNPGSGYVLLHHVFGEVLGKKGAWGHAIGGMGAITQAMAKVCIQRGARIVTDAAVTEVLVEKDRAVGVRLANGDVYRGKAIAANVNPKLLFRDLVDDNAVDADFRRRMQTYAYGSGSFRMNVALSELPNFTARPSQDPTSDHFTAAMTISPSLDYMDRAWRDAVDHGWSKRPVIEMLIPSSLDDTLAPPGQHVASLFCQHVMPQLPTDFPGGSSWDDHRETVADLMINTIDQYAPNFRASVLGRQINSPLDLERIFGLIGGDIFHGRLSLEQLFSARPVLGHGHYRMPVKGLYLCGSGAHPGGGVTGVPGHNAAREIIKDWKGGRVRRAA